MYRTRPFTVLLATAALLAACGDDTTSGDTTTSPTAASTTVAPATTAAPTTTEVVTTTTAPAVATTVPVALQQPAIWPAADVVFTTPEAAAQDFVDHVFGEGVLLGEFMAGDQRSGEIEAFASVDGAPIGTARSLLFLRMLGPDDGWFVLLAANEFVTISSPESMAVVPAGPLTVEGMARGFEANVAVTAFLAGHSDVEFDLEITMAGNLDEVLPYSVTLDLSSAAPGDIVVLLVHGGAGLETDPGDFGAIPVVIGS